MRSSVHVDAGYLYGALATRIAGSSNRAAIKVDEAKLVAGLIAIATADDTRLLRVLWYDAARDGLPDKQQRRIGTIDSVKLRMGRINPFGEQKGVDLRLGLDLVSLGVNRAVDIAYLISGDDDLTEAVEDAQQLGVRVHLLTVPDAEGAPINVASNLSLAVDSATTIPVALIDATVIRVVKSAQVAPTDVAPTDAATGVSPGTLPTPPAAGTAPRPPLPVGPLADTRVRPQVVPRAASGTVPRTAPTNPRATPVYSTSSGEQSQMDPGFASEEVIDEVAKSVLNVWLTTADPDELAQLQRNRPNIPQAIDRILLTDLVTRTGMYDIPTPDRFQLRAAFWNAVDQQGTARG